MNEGTMIIWLAAIFGVILGVLLALHGHYPNSLVFWLVSIPAHIANGLLMPRFVSWLYREDAA